MIKYLKITFITAICLGYTLIAQAQKAITEGVAIYTVEYDLPPEQQGIAGMLPKEFKVSFKGDYSLFKMDMGMFTTSVITNNLTNETLALTDMPMQNKKIAMKMSKSEVERMKGIESGEQDFEVKQTTETKMITGYNCTKYVLKDKIENTTNEMWATTEIQIPASALTSVVKGVKGVPVVFNNETNGMKTKLTLKSISQESVTDINFNIPAGYEIVDFNSAMGQIGR